jgi:hypothetical protein
LPKPLAKKGERVFKFDKIVVVHACTYRSENVRYRKESYREQGTCKQKKNEKRYPKNFNVKII